MPDWGLALHHDEYFVAVLAGGINKALPGSAVESVGNIEDAKRRLLQKGLGDCRVIVSGLRVPRSSSSNIPALDGEDRTALELVRWIRDAGADTLPVLLVAAVNNSNNDIGELKHVEVVCVNDIVERSVELIRAVMGTG